MTLANPITTPCVCGQPGCDKFSAGAYAPGHDRIVERLIWERLFPGQSIEEVAIRLGVHA